MYNNNSQSLSPAYTYVRSYDDAALYIVMYTYVCTHIYIYIYTYIHTYLHIYIYIYTHATTSSPGPPAPRSGPHIDLKVCILFIQNCGYLLLKIVKFLRSEL